MYGAARSDFFRYLLIYKIGGVYLDLKSNVNKSLNEIVDGKKFILSHWNNRRGDEYEGWGLHFKGLPRGEYQQWYIASVPGHPLLEKVILLVLHNIENYNPEISGVGAEAVLKTTGPVAYTQAIHPNLQVADYKLFDTHLDAGFIYSCFGKYGDDFFRHARLDSRFPHYSTLTDRLVFN
jgi:hypothetical protein